MVHLNIETETEKPSRETSVEEVNAIMGAAAQADAYEVLSCNEKPLVSTDFNHNAFSSNFDSNHTRVCGRLVKVLSWYDNEWGFSNRMLDTACLLGANTMTVSDAA